MRAGVGVDKPNPWAFDTTQFDNILKKLKVVSVSFFSSGLFENQMEVISVSFVCVCYLQQAAPSKKDDGKSLLLFNFTHF